MATSQDQDVQWQRRRRPGDPGLQAARRSERPRFDRFVAAMEEARETDAPVTRLYCEPQPGVPPAEAPRPARYPSSGGGRRRPGAPYVGKTALSASLPGRDTVRWFAIAGCVLLFSVLLVHWAIRTNVAETAQLFGAQVGSMLRGQPAAVEPAAERPESPAVEPSEDRSEPPQAPADQPRPAAAQNADALLAEAAALHSEAEQLPPDGSLERATGFPPLPRFKPARSDVP